MATDLADLVVARTETELQTELLAKLQTEGFPVADWQEGSVPRSLVKGDAAALADLDTTVAGLARGAFLSTADGLDNADEDEESSWLDLLAEERFDISRIPATFAEWSLTLACSGAAGPYTIAAGALVVASTGSVRFQSTNTGNVVVPSGGTAPITVKAQRKGTGGNTATPSVIVSPALPGVTISVATLATSARDREGDDALRQRCVDRWSTQSINGCGTRAAYRFHVLAATMDGTPTGTSCGVTRVGFLAPPGDGTVPIRIAGASGLLNNTQRDAVRSYIADRKPLTDTLDIQHGGTVNVDFTGSTVQFKSGQNTVSNQNAAKTAARNCVDGYAMGDDIEEPVIDEQAIAAAIYAALPGKIADVDLACGDVTVPAGSIAVCDETLITFS